MNNHNLEKNHSFEEKGVAIIKANNSGIISALDNGARVSPPGETGVSQVPAIPPALTAGGIASEQPSTAALQALPSPAQAMASLQGNDDRLHLMEVVRSVRQALRETSSASESSNATYAAHATRILGDVTEIVAELSKKPGINIVDKIIELQAAYLGAYADKANSFFSYRRSLDYWWRNDLYSLLKNQDYLQKELKNSTDEKYRNEIFNQIRLITTELKSKLKIFENINSLGRDYCVDKFLENKKLIESKVARRDVDGSLFLVGVLNRRLPDWQEKFREYNNASSGKYRLHAFIQSLTGIRPAEFESERKNISGPGGVQVTLIQKNRIAVRVLGAKTNKQSGQPVRQFEIEMDLPVWLIDELKQSGGQKLLTARTQALRDHYARISEQIFKGQRYGKAKKLLRINPYCFRHAVASNMRNDGWSPEEIAACLGHSSAETQRHYGLRRGGATNPKHACKTAVVKSSLAVSRSIKPSGNDWSMVSEQLTGNTKKTGTKKRPQV